MNTSDVSSRSTVELDTFGQNPRLSWLYTQLCFAFSLTDSEQQSQRDAAVNHLQQGLRKLSISIPWLAGDVIQDDAGVYKIQNIRGTPQLIVKDARHELPSFAQYLSAKFPFGMLDEAIIAPCSTLPKKDDKAAPVACLQLTFITGGMLLVFNGQHNCMDMRGQSVLINSLAKACRGESPSEEEYKAVNLTRADVPAISDLDNMIAASSSSGKSTTVDSSDQTLPVIEKSTWAYFNFSPDSLATLKATAMKSMTAAFVSTDDVLSAFVWQSVTRARLYRLDVNTSCTTFERQVDVREHLGLTSAYTGNAVHKTSDRMPVGQVLQLPLGLIASQLRQALSPSQGLGHQARVAAAQLVLSLKKSMRPSEQPRATLPSTDIKMSSWAKESCSKFDFGGPFGIAEAVRRPKFDAWEGLAYMMPKARNGDILVALCLRHADMDSLRSDEAFIRFGSYVG